MAGRNLFAATPAPAGKPAGRNLFAQKYDDPSLMQQLFDVKSSKTGESYLYGNKPAPAPYEDIQRTVADTATRGYLDKLRGPDEQARTAEARARMPGWVETPVDIGTTIASSPYRGVNAIVGGLEGVANAYGHQKNWVPTASDVGDMALQGGEGAALGYAGGKLGNYVGGKIAKREAEKAQPYRTNQEYLADVEQGTMGGVENTARAARIRAAQAAQGGTRDEFAAMMEGMAGTKSPAEIAQLERMTKPGKVARIGAAVPDKLTFNKGGDTIEDIAHTAVLDHLLTGGSVTAAKTAGTGLKWAGGTDWANRLPKGSVDDLTAILRDPAGVGPRLDPAISARWRDAFAKAAIGAGR